MMGPLGLEVQSLADSVTLTKALKNYLPEAVKSATGTGLQDSSAGCGPITYFNCALLARSKSHQKVTCHMPPIS
jgi:hypothetical protein